MRDVTGYISFLVFNVKYIIRSVRPADGTLPINKE